jgi:hypothetical protein
MTKQYQLKTTERNGFMVVATCGAYGAEDVRTPGTWPVLRVFTGGRGWASFRYYALLDHPALPLVVKIVDPPDYELPLHKAKKLVDVEFVSKKALLQHADDYSLKPYVRVSGIAAPNITLWRDEGKVRQRLLKDMYGIGNNRTTVALSDLIEIG